MGLDMYLLAETEYHITSDIAQELLAMGEWTDYPEEGPACYLSGWEHGTDADRAAYHHALKLTRTQDMASGKCPSVMLYVRDDKVVVETKAMYWRKANAIHAWFVENVQDGVDKCQLSDPIDAEQLAHLASICDQAVAAYHAQDLHTAQELLPTRAGFFFGSTEVDGWWCEDVRYTAYGIRAVLNACIERRGGVTLRYQSSW